MTMLFEHDASPAGYPRLGLVSRTFSMPNRRHATAAALKHRLTSWEKAQGNPHFVVTGLEALLPDQRMEIVQVYVALRERYPSVRVDRLELAYRKLPGALGESAVYDAHYPLLRRALAETGTAGTPETYAFARSLAALMGRGGKALLNEVQAAEEWKVSDVTAAGLIRLSISATSEKGRTTQASRWTRMNESRLRRGLSAEVQPIAVSLAALTLIHEFGHLVDGTIGSLGPQVVDRVYGALSTEVLGLTSRPHVYQWRHHLANYPVRVLEGSAGPVAGGTARSVATRQALSPVIADMLGTYAAVSRDELFAESFMLAWVARDARLRSQLAPLRSELASVGLGRTTTPRRSRKKITKKVAPISVTDLEHEEAVVTIASTVTETASTTEAIMSIEPQTEPRTEPGAVTQVEAKA